jgi:hypothetical protein
MHEQFVEPARRSANAVLDWRQSSAAQAKAVLQTLTEQFDGEPLTVSG